MSADQFHPTVLSAVRHGASKRPLRQIVDSSTATAALTVPLVASSLPAAAYPTEDYPSARLFFGGVGTANHTINYQVILWYPFMPADPATGPAYVPAKVAGGVATLGAKVYTVTSLGVATALWADTLTNTIAGLVGVHSPANDDLAWLVVNVENAVAIQVGTDVVDATNADVFLQPSDLVIPWTLAIT